MHGRRREKGVEGIIEERHEVERGGSEVEIKQQKRARREVLYGSRRTNVDGRRITEKRCSEGVDQWEAAKAAQRGNRQKRRSICRPFIYFINASPISLPLGITTLN